MKKGFTLAEILIVLVLISVLTMVLLPMAFQSSPDEAVMKFKKGNNTLLTAVKELVSSDEYYQDGDLGIRANGQLIDGTHNGDITYFCNSLADILSTKSVNCSENKICKTNYCWHTLSEGVKKDMTIIKQNTDKGCLNSENTIGAEITTNDDIVYYQVSPAFMFGISERDIANIHATSEEDESLKNTENNTRRALGKDKNGFVAVYKIICMDIDGINKGEEPFGYSLRYDGKIIPGLRADEWLNKSIQKNN